MIETAALKVSLGTMKRRAFLCTTAVSLAHGTIGAEAISRPEIKEPLLRVLGTSGWDLRILAYPPWDLAKAIADRRISLVWETIPHRPRVSLEVPSFSLGEFLVKIHPENVLGCSIWGVRLIQKDRVLQGRMAVRLPDLRVEVPTVLKDILFEPGDCVAIGPYDGWRM